MEWGLWKPFGTYAELIAVPEVQAYKIDEAVDFGPAACMGIPASTAYYGVLASGSVKNKTVLISGGAGAVGFYGIQIAKLSVLKSSPVSEEKAKIAEDAGADKIINYKEDVIAEILKFTKDDGLIELLRSSLVGTYQ